MLGARVSVLAAASLVASSVVSTGGIGFRAGSLVPYLRARLIARSGTVFVPAASLRS